MLAARLHLAQIVGHWPDLEDALAAPNVSSWPPAGLRHHLAATSRRDDVEERAKLRSLERSPEQLGETAAPIRIDVLDVMREVTEQLVDLADHTAARIQRPAMSHAPRTMPAVDRARRNELADEDAADSRRWRYVGQRSAVDAATWLADRLQAVPGPFRPLPSLQAEHIGRVAQTAAQRVLSAVELTRHSRRLDRPCPVCRGQLRVSGGDGTPPAVTCRDCGRCWREIMAA